MVVNKRSITWTPYKKQQFFVPEAGYTSTNTTFRNGKTRTKTKTKRRRTRAVTFQRDSAPIYFRKRAPWRTRRRMRRWKRKFMYTLNQNLGVRTYAIQHSRGQTSAVNSQGVLNVASCGYNGGSVDGFNDISQLFTAEALSQSQKINMKTCKMDLTIHNTGADTMELDMYKYYVKKDVDFADVLSKYVDIMTNNTVVNLPQTVTTVGWTPFDAAQAANEILITKAKRYYISAGQAISFIDRNSKDFVIDGDDFFKAASNNNVKRGTWGYIMIYKGLPTVTNTVAGPATIRFSMQNTYRYCINAKNHNASGKAV